MMNFKNVLKTIAEQNNTTPEEVLKEMQVAIDAGFDNPDPIIHEKWKQIPHKGKRPTAEEVLTYAALQVQNKGYAS